MPWLMALDLPQPVGLPPDVTLNHDGELLSRKPVNERIRYTLISNPQYVLEPQLDARARTRLTRLPKGRDPRSAEHTSELQSLMRTSYAVFCLKTKQTSLTTIDYQAADRKTSKTLHCTLID